MILRDGEIPRQLKDGEACDHPGCLCHVSHPCEGCGRIAGSVALTERYYNRQIKPRIYIKILNPMPGDTEIAQKLLRGEITLDELPPNMKLVNDDGETKDSGAE